MMRFTSHHESAFVADARQRFVAKTVEFLENEFPCWARTTPEGEQRAFAESMLDLAHQCQLFEALSAQKLAYYQLEYGFPLPLCESHQALLHRPGLDETLRMDDFHRQLTSPDETLKIISVEQLDQLYQQHLGAADDSPQPLTSQAESEPHGA